ncbi:hypothetical protein MRX96_058306 [Rhipicephalus microplus]
MRPQLATRSGNKIGGQRKTAGLRADRCHLPGLLRPPERCAREGDGLPRRPSTALARVGSALGASFDKLVEAAHLRMAAGADRRPDGIRALPYRAAAIESRDGETGALKCALSAAAWVLEA